MPRHSISLVGLHGLTGSSVGMFLPVFAQGDRGYCLSGDGHGGLMGKAELTGLIDAGAVILLQSPVSLEAIPEFASGQVLRAGLGTGRFPAPAYLLVLKTDVWEALNPCLGVLMEEGSGRAALAIDDQALIGRKAFLAPTERFVGTLFPSIMQAARQSFLAELGAAIAESPELPFRKRRWEALERIAQVMVAIAWDTPRLQEAVKFQGLVVLTGPFAENFRPWHSVTTTALNLPPVPVEHLMNASFGLLESQVTALNYRELKERVESWRTSYMEPTTVGEAAPELPYLPIEHHESHTLKSGDSNLVTPSR